MGHVVVELQDINNRQLIRLVGGDIVECVVAHEFIGRLIIQSSRQQGISKVLENLFGFGGDEFYMQEWKQLEGKTYATLWGSLLGSALNQSRPVTQPLGLAGSRS